MIRFKKIKRTSDGKIHIVHEVERGDVWDEYSMSSSQEPKPSFKKAFDALNDDMAEVCELPLDRRGRCTVKSCSFSYGGDADVMGVTLTGIMRLDRSNAPLNLNTPHKIEKFYSEHGDEKQLMTEDCLEHVLNLIAEAEDFVKGDRAQTDMFAEATQKAAA